MPLTSLARIVDPPVPDDVLTAADDLHYRDFLTVALVVPEERGFPDNWIYIHSPDVKVGRIQNFGVWSPYLVKDGRTCLGMEYFVFEGDELWTSSDDDLVALATKELASIGLIEPSDVEVGYVVRMPKAYPVYDDVYRDNVEVIRRWFEEHAPNVHPVGRNGMHKYNNQDHSMYTAMLTVENIHGAHHDIWAVNVEEEYHETSDNSTAAGSRRNRTRRADHPPEGGQGRERHHLVVAGTEESAAPERSFPWWIAAACGVGLALRLVYVFVVKAGAPPGRRPYYHDQAQLNVDGHWFVNPTLFLAKHHLAALVPSAQHPPMFTLLLSWPTWSDCGAPTPSWCWSASSARPPSPSSAWWPRTWPRPGPAPSPQWSPPSTPGSGSSTARSCPRRWSCCWPR